TVRPWSGPHPGAKIVADHPSRGYFVAARPICVSRGVHLGKIGEDIVTVADKLLAAAVSAGATDAPLFTTPAQPQFGGGGFGPQQANRVEFYRANLTALRQEAIKLAVADALANAKVATGAANITTKEIVTITDQTQNQFGPFGVQGQAANTGRGEVQGDAELTVTLSVTFSY
ncbi:MAG: DUF541 domain-containing protein, partial [Planctomycetes bacterium]|nr:DUF541 domain-containing protein [Planctomycetota bacterium]